MKYLILSLLLAGQAQAMTFWEDLLELHEITGPEQSYCYYNENGTVHGANIHAKMRPASVTKLYVTYWALKTKGPEFRHRTEFFLKDDNLHIKGAHDTFFVSENIFFVMAKLIEEGVDHIETFSFDEKFFFNWENTPATLEQKLLTYLNTSSWPASIAAEYEALKRKNQELNLGFILPEKLDFSVGKVQFAPIFSMNEINPQQWFFSSSPLKRHLKEMNIYSNNFMALRFFDWMGGPAKFAAFMQKEFGVGNGSISFTNGAGWEQNYTTCALTLRLLTRLHDLILAHDLNPHEIISVPSVDPGTLRNRVPRSSHRRALVAKTGTLRHTSALAGLLYTAARGVQPFTVFNHSWKTQNARALQDDVVYELFTRMGGVETFEYERNEYIPLIDIEFSDF